MHNQLVMIRGGGDLGSGVATRLFYSGLKIIILEIENPTAIRLPVSFANAVYEGCMILEGIKAELATSQKEAENLINRDKIAVLIDPEGKMIKKFKPRILIDAMLAKKNLGTYKEQAPLVIGLGPGFTAGKDVDAVVETKRGHYLGKIIYQGKAAPDTGIPGDISGESINRLIKSPTNGQIRPFYKIGDLVSIGDIIAEVEGVPVKAKISGVLRGMINSCIWVTEGVKIGDIDPRGVKDYCFTISDKARCIGGSVLEIICKYLNDETMRQ